MDFMTFAVAVVLFIMSSIALYFRIESLRERERAESWQAKCSERGQRVHELGEANVVCQKMIDSLQDDLRQMRHVCMMLGNSKIDPNEIKRV